MEPVENLSRSSDTEPVDGVRRVTFVFADIVDFTGITDRVGDQEAYRMIRGCQALIAGEVERHGGEVLELRGDGFLLAFDDSLPALCCAAAVQRLLESSRTRLVRMRIGVHSGRAIRDGGSYFGRTVIEAFRVATLAGPGRILASREACAEIPDGRLRFRRRPPARLRGLPGRHPIFELVWREGEGDLALEHAARPSHRASAHLHA